jgi:hypothetical protein
MTNWVISVGHPEPRYSTYSKPEIMLDTLSQIEVGQRQS